MRTFGCPSINYPRCELFLATAGQTFPLRRANSFHLLLLAFTKEQALAVWFGLGVIQFI